MTKDGLRESVSKNLRELFDSYVEPIPAWAKELLAKLK